MSAVAVPLPPGHRLDHELTTTTGRNNGIQWTLWTKLDDLDFADDLALLSHNHTQMQDKTTRLAETSAGTGLKINKRKTELMKINTTAHAPVHQSQLAESRLGKSSPSSTWGVWWTSKGARTVMSRPGLAKPEQPSSCSKTSGRQ